MSGMKDDETIYNGAVDNCTGVGMIHPVVCKFVMDAGCCKFFASVRRELQAHLDITDLECRM